MSRVTLVVPAYNESGNIEPFFKSCTEVQKGSSHIFDYVFIDDGSSDGTFDVVKRLSERNPNSGIKGIRFSRNFGKEAGILAGLRNSTGEYTVVVDADLQQNPKYIIEMADFLDNNPNYDCVACYQKDRKENGLMKFMKKSFYKIMDNSSDTNFVEDASDFRMMRREMVDAVLQLGEYHRFSKGISRVFFLGLVSLHITCHMRSRKGIAETPAGISNHLRNMHLRESLDLVPNPLGYPHG